MRISGERKAYAALRRKVGQTQAQEPICECHEESIGILSIGDVFMKLIHEYPDLTVHLILINTTITEGEQQKIKQNGIGWIKSGEIPNYEFCPADEEILKEITKRYE